MRVVRKHLPARGAPVVEADAGRGKLVGTVYDGAVFTGPDDERLNPCALGFSADETAGDDDRVVQPPFHLGCGCGLTRCDQNHEDPPS